MAKDCFLTLTNRLTDRDTMIDANNKTNNMPTHQQSNQACHLDLTYELEALGVLDDDPTKTRTDKSQLQTAKQNAQARLVLIQLQGMLIILMIGAMIWLGMSHQSLSKQVDERLKVVEGLTDRMNTIDDRLFAITPNTDTTKKSDTRLQSNSQLIVVQLQMAQTLANKGDYQGASDMLSLIAWQIKNADLDMAAPIVSSLQVAIQTDIERLSVLNSQNPWQADIALLNNVGAYLRTLDGSGMTYVDLVLHDARMLVSLSISAAVMRERDVFVVHLTEVANKLNELRKLKEEQTPNLTIDDKEKTASSVTTHEVKDLAGAIMAINHLLANPPAHYHLTSLAITTA